MGHRSGPQSPCDAQEARGDVDPEVLQNHRLAEDADAIQLVIVNGRISPLSRLGSLPDGVYIGSLEDAPAAVAEQLVRACTACLCFEGPTLC